MVMRLTGKLVNVVKPGSPDGKWVTVGLRLREADVARLDAVCGGDRSGWLRQVALAELDSLSFPIPPREVVEEAVAVIQAPPGERPAKRQRKPRGPSGAEIAALRERALAADVEPVTDPADLARMSVESHMESVAGKAARRAADRTGEACPHPKGRRQKAGTYCPACGTGGLKP